MYMWPTAADGMEWSVSVGHDREACENGLTDRDAIWKADLFGIREPCNR